MDSTGKRTPEISSKRSTAIHALLEDAKRRLVETGTRNRLVHVNRENKRANALNIINERSDDIYEILRSKGRKMRFMGCGKDEDEDDFDSPRLESLFEGEPFDEARYTDNYLETPLGTDALQKRLLRLARDATTAEEEQGVNILYLALGFLTWFEDKKSAVKRQAPLVLLPVELIRNTRTSTYDVKCRDDDLVTNLPLQERLKDDFGIELPPIEETEEWKPSAYFAAIAPLIADRHNWFLDEDGMQLGFFSFAKLLMLRDLDPDNWPEASLIAHELINGLLVTGFEAEEPLFAANDKLDELLEPADIVQVVDADASQTKVIEEVRSGRNLVVQGPPGTGKSQTITNVIAAAVHDGKRVLFVAEKMAALSVVHKRLVGVGLQDVCLELHSRSANKKSVVGEIGRTLNAASAVPKMPDEPGQLKITRDTLNEISGLLHSPVPETDFTPFEVISQIVGFIGRGTPLPSLRNSSFAEISSLQCKEICEHIDTFADALVAAGPRQQHPFYGTRNLALQPTDAERLKQNLPSLLKTLKVLIDNLEEIAKILGTSEVSTFSNVDTIRELLLAMSEAPEDVGQFLPDLLKKTQSGRLNEGLEAGFAWQTAHANASDSFADVAWEAAAAQLRAPLVRGTTSFFARLGWKYRRASRELESLLAGALPKTAADRLALVEKLLDVQRKRAVLSGEEAFLKDALGVHWRGEKTQFERVLAATEWIGKIETTGVIPHPASLAKLADDPQRLRQLASDLERRSAEVANGASTIFEELDLDRSLVFSESEFIEIPLGCLLEKLDAIGANTGRYGEWTRLYRSVDALRLAGLESLVDQIDQGTLEADAAEADFRYARAEAQWQKARSVFSALDKLADVSRQKFVEEFQSLEKKRTEDVRTIIRARHLEQLPRGAVGEMAYIRGEIARRRGHKSIRKLIEAAGEMVQRIKPVFLMSPISIAQFLPPGSVEFDLLVIDEASQVRPEDALGAIARAKQIVVVGDQKQLPPTSFFDRITGNDATDAEEDDDDLLSGAARATELESILTLCSARGVGKEPRMLEWHYRSRDPSLIRVSNAEFYDHRLVLPPSPLQQDEDYGFKFTRVDGAYSSQSKGPGRPGTNKIEAQAVVQKVAAHALKWPELSLGIVTFSGRQRNMITELLEHTRRSDPVLEAFLREGKSEDLFVKNIENVQGDERDVIFISVGYGPHEPRGRLASMNFGPVNSDGGERRLNVLFSRSRVRCEVFASFDPGDIDLSRTTKEGPRVLKRFLEFAKTGLLDEKISTGFLADSPFEEDVAEEIRKLGFDVDYQVGSGGFLIDLGVKHPERPGQYMLAVECDGATYHSALWARERDRLRQDVLEGLGWTFHRIWSTDWFHRRQQEVIQLQEALIAARNASDGGIAITGANAGTEQPPQATLESNEEFDDPVVALHIAPITAPPYKQAQMHLKTSMEPHEVSPHRLADMVSKIVEVEGPVHQDEVARRLAAAFGKKQAGRRILETTLKALHIAEGTGDSDVLSDGVFWFTSHQRDAPTIRDRSGETGATLKAEMLPPMEIRAAAELVVEESGTVEKDELIRAIARLLGFKRVGSGLRETIERVLPNDIV